MLEAAGIPTAPLSPANPSNTVTLLSVGAGCTGAACRCVAVGSATSGSATGTLIEAGKGKSWSVTTSPDQGSSSNSLQSVSCATPDTCAAVGNYQNSSGTTRTLVESALQPPPLLTKFTPSSGPPGTTVTITGKHLSGATKVTFNGKPATISSDASTKIKVKVPSGATTGKIKVTTPRRDGRVRLELQGHLGSAGPARSRLSYGPARWGTTRSAPTSALPSVDSSSPASAARADARDCCRSWRSRP